MYPTYPMETKRKMVINRNRVANLFFEVEVILSRGYVNKFKEEIKIVWNDIRKTIESINIGMYVCKRGTLFSSSFCSSSSFSLRLKKRFVWSCKMRGLLI